jgi:chromosome partitioning protein
MRVVSVINHKGGVGKTTFTACVSQALALCGFRVLAIDNDSQHNLSTMLGTGVQEPNIRDAYAAADGEAPAQLLRAIRTTMVSGLHVVTADRSLSANHVRDRFFLKRCFGTCDLGRFYDYVLIDNAPGLDALQVAAMYASHELFVPTALGQFAVDGVVEMEQMLLHDHPDAPRITRVIPNFYKDTKRQNSYVAALRSLFAGRVTKTVIPFDPVFDEVVTAGKVLFIHRLSSRGAAYYLKIVHELFDFSEKELWETMMDRRRQRLGDEARERLLKHKTTHQKSRP